MRRIATAAAALLACAAITPRSAGQTTVVYDGTIDLLSSEDLGASAGTRTSSTVDYFRFTAMDTGSVSFDLLSMETDFSVTSDVNADGEIAFVDTQVILFRDDGSLDTDDYIAMNDDFRSATPDGSIHRYDSYLTASLEPGDYVLAIGAYSLSVADAIAGTNASGYGPYTWDDQANALLVHDHGDFRLTASGPIAYIPASASILIPALALAYAGMRRSEPELY